MSTLIKIDKERARVAALRKIEVEEPRHKTALAEYNEEHDRYSEFCKQVSRTGVMPPFPIDYPKDKSKRAKDLLIALNQTTYSTIDMSVEDVVYLFGEARRK